MWEPGEEAWAARLAALRSYRRATGHLAPRQDAVWDEDAEIMPVGQHMANLHRKGAKNGLGKDKDTATTRAAQLTAIDKDRNRPCPPDWQRHHRVLADIVDADGQLPDIAPGVLWDGDDIGRWLQQQKQPATRAQLLPKQQARLTALGVQPDQAPPPAPAASRGAKGAEQGAAGIPARPGSPRTVGRAGRRGPAGAARPRRRGHG
ncbi:helicase associated domain-containing protein [Streptomyces vinaceus]|uniref:helicase associated domain-containing protein n=1 Tax=Streptomyces vinaceus TaxID=1960 RepID=UPI0037FFFA6F